MVSIKILAVGKIQSMYKPMIDEFEKRLSRYAKLELVEVADEQAPEKLSEAQKRQVMLAEWERLDKKIKETDFVVALDSRGKKYSSEGFAEFIDKNSEKQIVFILGGSLGFCEEALMRANAKCSLSDMTFTHSMARVILAEQIYRAFRIIKNEPYHK